MAKHNNIFKVLLFAILPLALNIGCQKPVQQYGMYTAIPKESIDQYKKFLTDSSADLQKQIHKNNIKNYSIYLSQTQPDQYYLFGYCQYTGCDFQKDIAKIPSFKSLPNWTPWQQVFYNAGPPYKGKPNKRLASVIGIAEKNILPYTQMHAAVWPGVLASIERCNIHDYSIYLGQPQPDQYLLFSYFEYVGDNFDKDMSSIGDEVTQVWWTYTAPLQTPLPTRKPGEHWAAAEELFHID